MHPWGTASLFAEKEKGKGGKRWPAVFKILRPGGDTRVEEGSATSVCLSKKGAKGESQKGGCGFGEKG